MSEHENHPSRRQAIAGLSGLAVLAAASGAEAAQAGAQSSGSGAGAKELRGKVAVVTGASRNLGRGFAEVLAKNGANVLVHYHTEKSRADAEQTAKLVRAHGVKAALAAGDLSVVANIRKMYDVAQKELGGVDVVVNNAGLIRKKPLAEVTEEDFDKSFGINAKGLFFSMQEAAKRIRDNGRIINIGTSLLGATTGFYSVYAGSKAPVEDFTRALAKEIGARGVTVNTVAPGALDTPFFHGQETKETVAYITKAHVAGRLGKVEDIVPVVEFLASPRAGWISGQTIFVNNAYLAR